MFRSSIGSAFQIAVKPTAQKASFITDASALLAEIEHLRDKLVATRIPELENIISQLQGDIIARNTRLKQEQNTSYQYKKAIDIYIATLTSNKNIISGLENSNTTLRRENHSLQKTLVQFRRTHHSEVSSLKASLDTNNAAYMQLQNEYGDLQLEMNRLRTQSSRSSETAGRSPTPPSTVSFWHQTTTHQHDAVPTTANTSQGCL